MKEQTAKNALQFLERVQLQGKEVFAFIEVVRELQAIAESVEPEVD